MLLTMRNHMRRPYPTRINFNLYKLNIINKNTIISETSKELVDRFASAIKEYIISIFGSSVITRSLALTN